MQFVNPTELLSACGLNHMTEEVYEKLCASGWQLVRIASKGRVVLARAVCETVIYCEIACETGLFRQLAVEMQNRERAEEIATMLAKEMEAKLAENPNLWRFPD